MRRVFTVAVLAITFLGPMTAPPAKACSCVLPEDVQEWVDDAEAAFVGTMIDIRRDGLDDFEVEYVVEVETWVKGDAGDPITVISGQGSGDCGFGDQRGARMGALLHQEGDQLYSNICSQIDPETLLASAKEPTAGPTEPTTPPLVVEPEALQPEESNTQIVAMVVLGATLIGLVLLITMTKGPHRAPSSDRDGSG